MTIYEVRMTNGDTGEALSIDAALTAAWTMATDPDELSLPWLVAVDGVDCEWATKACLAHVREKAEAGNA